MTKSGSITEKWWECSRKVAKFVLERKLTGKGAVIISLIQVNITKAYKVVTFKSTIHLIFLVVTDKLITDK